MSTADYPRWMFHRDKPAVIVGSEAEEASLGPGWSRIIPVPAGAEEPDQPEQAVEETPKKHTRKRA